MMGYIAQFYTTIRDALWDTLSGLYSEYLEFGHHYKMVQPLVHCVVSKERFWTIWSASRFEKTYTSCEFLSKEVAISSYFKRSK